MTVFRRLSVILQPVFIFFVGITTSVVAIQATPSDPVRITAVANVTIRATPSLDAPVVAQLPLGSEVAEAGPIGLDKTWVRVRLADGGEGWLQSKFARPLDPVWRWPVFDEIIASRLGRKGDGFPANVELVAFIDRVAPEYTDPDGRARIELSRLRALSATLASIPFRGARREPYSSWLGARKSEVIYDEPGGRWMLAPAPLWDLHARHSGTSIADDIAWFAVTNGLPGECEGFLPCYLEARNRSEAEYLRRHPAGRHATEAVDIITRTAGTLTAAPLGKVGYEFDRTRDCRDVVASVDALTGAVQRTGASNRDAAIGSLATVRKYCQ